MKPIELLAPARDLTCGIAAVRSGADAVYMGPPSFGAREAAGNSLDDFARLVEYAHRYWVKVYATVNTLLRDEEIPPAVRLLRQLHEIGVDAVIIQDMGLLECDLPPMPLTASTQMHNHTPARVAFLERVGFHRVVLARELDLDEIRAIRRAAPRIELEAFIHGALCVSYSGQCYMSYALGGRSGNRGRCAQPCRKPFTLRDGTGRILERHRHLLSLRDLNLTAHLGELIEAGVTSFKIEGRLKDEAYVSNVVAHYRAELDRLLPLMGRGRSSSGTGRPGFRPDPARTFNRGFTDYFLHGRQANVGALDTPKMTGPLVGTVKSVRGNRLTMNPDSALLHPGDGLCFFDPAGTLRGSVVNHVSGKQVEVESAAGLEPGMDLYRSHDHRFMTDIRGRKSDRRISVNLAVTGSPEGLRLTLLDEDGVWAEGFLPGPFPVAEKPEAARATIHKQLSRTGESEFECASFLVDADPVPFVPVSALNSFRREALKALTAARVQARPRVQAAAVMTAAPYPQEALTWRGNVLNRYAEAFYRRHGVTSIEPAAESGMDLQGQAVMTMRYCLRYELGCCPKSSGTPAPPEPLTLEDDEGNRFRLGFDCRACMMSVYLETRAT